MVNSYTIDKYLVKKSANIFNIRFFHILFGFAYLIQIYVISEDEEEPAFSDVNIFLEKDLEDLIEYAIILPRLFKRHHRYVIDFERDNVCTFKQFGEKVNLWKKFNGLL